MVIICKRECSVRSGHGNLKCFALTRNVVVEVVFLNDSPCLKKLASVQTVRSWPLLSRSVMRTKSGEDPAKRGRHVVSRHGAAK